MNVNIVNFLRDYPIETVELNQLDFPIQGSSGGHRVLVMPSENIEEMMEDVADGEDSVRLYVEEQQAKIDERSAVEVLRGLVDMELSASGVSAIEADQADLPAIYAAYVTLWEDQNELLDEQMRAMSAEEEATVQATTDLPHAMWVRQRDEDGILLLDLPETETWKAPLIVPMGGYNDCPKPLDQAVLFRDWHKRYGAVPTAVTADSWLFRATHLPATDEEALNLAREHLIFCSYVLEGFSSIGQYAGYLKRSCVWSFWWD